MQICCTKKLLDELNVAVADNNGEKDFFCWSANLLTFKRRKAVVVVNDSNRFGFVLYSLKSKDFRQLDKLIADGIRTCLRDERIKEEIIERYFDQAKEFVFTKTRGRVPVARLNKACEIVEILADILDASRMYQTDLSGRINRDFFKPGKDKDYMHPYEVLKEDFQDYYGDKIIQSEAADLLIKLDLGEYSASRRLIVPLGVSFKDLHEIIQIAFGWQGRHLHDFKVFEENENLEITEAPPWIMPPPEMETYEERGARKRFVLKAGVKMVSIIYSGSFCL